MNRTCEVCQDVFKLRKNMTQDRTTCSLRCESDKRGRKTKTYRKLPKRLEKELMIPRLPLCHPFKSQEIIDRLRARLPPEKFDDKVYLSLCAVIELDKDKRIEEYLAENEEPKPDVEYLSQDPGRTFKSVSSWQARRRLHDLKNEIVYFIESDSGRVKIGFTNNIKLRLQTLRYANPEKIALRAYMVGDFWTEQRMHGVFSRLRSQGEWFWRSDFVINQAIAHFGAHRVMS